MGFLGALGRIIQGKPVFEVPQQPQTPQLPPQPPIVGESPVAGDQPQTAPAFQNGQKVYPRVYVERVEYRNNGSNIDLDFFIQNDSQLQIDLDRLEVLGRSQDLGTFLRPGEERKFRVYSGPRPTNPNMTRVTLDFKTPDSDMFRTEHTLEFKQEPDHTYSTDRIRFIRVDDV